MRNTIIALVVAVSCSACAADQDRPSTGGAGADESALAPNLTSTLPASTDDAGERVGEAQEPITPLGLICWLATNVAVGVAATASCSHHPEDPSCAWGAGAGGIALSTICLFL